MSLLPASVDVAQYFAELYKRPLVFWQPALTAIAARHGLPDGPWERAALGRNIVFLAPDAVIKLGPPFWAGDMEREAQALAVVAGCCPVRMPRPLATGLLEAWDYLITDRCVGQNLYALWGKLPHAARVELAEQHGRLMAAVHAIPVAGLPEVLGFDWERMLAGQRADLAANLARSGLAEPLLNQVEAYLAEFAALSAAVDADVLVHGDLTHLNLLVEERDGRWTISSLLDWGDVKVGPWTHELISPGVHMYLGDREALAACYRGYGRIASHLGASVARVATARAVLYYADEFATILGRLPAGASCRDWPAVERSLWHMEAL